MCVCIQLVTFQWRAWEAHTKLDTDSHCELNTHKCTLVCSNRTQDFVPSSHTLHKKGFGKTQIETISCLSEVLQIIMTFSSIKYRIILHRMHLGGKSCRSTNGWLLNYSWALKLILNHSRALHWEINVVRICCWLFTLIHNIVWNYDWLRAISSLRVTFFCFRYCSWKCVFCFSMLLGPKIRLENVNVF